MRPMRTKTRPINFRIPEDTHAWLESLATRKKTTITALVLLALEKLMHPKK